MRCNWGLGALSPLANASPGHNASPGLLSPIEKFTDSMTRWNRMIAASVAMRCAKRTTHPMLCD
jgi:hypothetical protein